MEIISAREFRTNQGSVLRRALRGESIILSSRLGNFKITPISEEESLTTRICRGLKQVKQIEEGKIQAKTIDSFLDEL